MSSRLGSWSPLGKKVLLWDVEGIKTSLYSSEGLSLLCRPQEHHLQDASSGKGHLERLHLSGKGSPLWVSISCACWLIVWLQLLPGLESKKLGQTNDFGYWEQFFLLIIMSVLWHHQCLEMGGQRSPLGTLKNPGVWAPPTQTILSGGAATMENH